MAEAFDFKKMYKELYGPKTEPSLVEVPAMPFLMLDGQYLGGISNSAGTAVRPVVHPQDESEGRRGSAGLFCLCGAAAGGTVDDGVRRV